MGAFLLWLHVGLVGTVAVPARIFVTVDLARNSYAVAMLPIAPPVAVALQSVDIEDVWSRTVTTQTSPKLNVLDDSLSRPVTVQVEPKLNSQDDTTSRSVTVQFAPKINSIEDVPSRVVNVQFDPYRFSDTVSRTYVIDGTSTGTITIVFSDLADALDAPTSIDLQWLKNEPDEQLVFAGTQNLTSGSFAYSPGTRRELILRFKSDTWLQKKQVIDFGQGVFAATVTLTNGDCNGDNVIDLGDFDVIASAFGTEFGDGSYDPLADLNRDEVVDLGDFDIFAAGFGLEGDP